MEFVKLSAPIAKRKDNLTGMLLDVIIALAPVAICAWIIYPLSAVRMFPLSIGTAVLVEFLFTFITKKSVKAFTLNSLLSCIITGMIFALATTTNPGWDSGIAYWRIPVCVTVAILLGKLLFQGFGNNYLNPAALGLAVSKIAFPATGFEFSSPTGYIVDTYAGGTALGAKYSTYAPNQLLDLFLGRTAGTLGEGFAFAILIGLAYLLVRKTIPLKSFLAYFLGFAVFALTAGVAVQIKLQTMSENIGGAYFLLFFAYQILSGGFLFGAVYMITDPVTGPFTEPSRILYGLFGGFVVAMIRYFFPLFPASIFLSGFKEGVAVSILLANILARVLDLPKFSKKKWNKWHTIVLASILCAGMIAIILRFSFIEKGLIP